MQILVLHEKHGDRYIALTEKTTKEDAALKILDQRLRDQWYYEDDNDLIEIKNIVTKRDGPHAYRLLCSRNDYEYEGFEVVETESLHE